MPLGNDTANPDPAAAYNIKEWMWGLEEEASKVDVRNSDVGNCGLE